MKIKNCKDKAVNIESSAKPLSTTDKLQKSIVHNNTFQKYKGQYKLQKSTEGIYIAQYNIKNIKLKYMHEGNQLLLLHEEIKFVYYVQILRTESHPYIINTNTSIFQPKFMNNLHFVQHCQTTCR